MRYGNSFKVIDLNQRAMKIVHSAIASTDLKWKKGAIRRGEESSQFQRSSEIAWIHDTALAEMLFGICSYVNTECNWNLNITGMEAIQFGSYPEGGFYDWHVDQSSKVGIKEVRKISMSLFMNDPKEYEGGEFDLEIYKPGADPRFETFKLPKGTAIFFQGDQWHRVRPITAGLRKSLVAWFYGPPYV